MASPDTSNFADVPSIRTFQFDGDGLGNVKNSVNLFRGDVNFPLRLLSLPGRNGLDVSLTALYESNVTQAAGTWNVEAPTGILGLGWSLPFDQIVANTQGTGTRLDDTYYLLSSGAGNRLVKIGTAANGAWVFQAESYEFWSILYYPNDERWEITREDGSRSIYGGKAATPDAIQWGVKWGNWIGSSAQSLGQQPLALAWNLSATQNTWGQSITYSYQNVEQAVGPQGLPYTKASYLSQITDSTGRTLLFSYGDKTYKAGQVCEYQDPHKPVPNDVPDAYQSRYETLYLDAIAVQSEAGNRLFTLRFGYDLINAGNTGDPAYPFLWKRVLTSVQQENAAGVAPPGLVFQYYGRGDAHPGALASITYPAGATAAYTYAPLPIPAARNLQITSPLPGAVPRVWFGEGYVVITWYSAASSQLQVSVYSWNGRWINWAPGSTISATITAGSLGVAATGTFFAVYFQTAGAFQVYLFRQSSLQLGQWAMQSKVATLATGAGATTVAAGNDFLVACNAGFTQGVFQGWAWNWRQNQWTLPALPKVPLASPALIAMAAGPNFYVVVSYNPGQKTASFQLLYRDDVGQWSSGATWTNTLTLYMDPSKPGVLPLAWSLGSSFAVATYPTAVSSTQVSYELRLFQWDETYSVTNAASPLVEPLTSTVSGGQLQFPVFASRVVEALVANNLQLLRYAGAGASTGWIAHALQSSPTAGAVYQFADGTDAAVLAQTASGQTQNLLASFDPNQPNASGWTSQGLTVQSPYPSLQGDFLTAGTTVYRRDFSGQWSALSSFLTSGLNPQSLQNRAPMYLAYETGTGSGAQAYVALLKNGSLQTPAIVGSSPQRVYVPQSAPGTSLAGPDAFVTYTGASFDQASSLFLYQITGGNFQGSLVDLPVTSLKIDDGFPTDTPFQQAYLYDASTVIVDPGTAVAQYSKVTTVAGSSDGKTQPAGSTVSYFSNSSSQQAGVFYPQGWIYNYVRMLNGMLLATVGYDAAGNQVSRTVNYWSVTTQDAAGQLLFGGYARQVQGVSTVDGVTRTVQTTYDRATGLPVQTQTSSLLGGAAPKVFTRQLTYAWQVAEYAQAMTAAHLLSPVVQTVNQTDGVVTSSAVTTWQSWDSGGAIWKWAPYQTWRWLGTTAKPAFDFTPGASSPGWQKTSEIVSRTPQGAAQEQVDINGVPTSLLFGQQGLLPTARFVNGSLTAGEVGYLGFEAYESNGGWTLGSGSSVVSGDAFTGQRSLQMPAGSQGPAATFEAPGQAGDFLLSCWVKTPAGFGTDPGTAAWQIQAAQNGSPVGGPFVVPFTDTGNAWAYLFFQVPLQQLRADHGLPADAPLSLAVSAANGKQTARLLLDDVAVCPFTGNFMARVYDPDYRLVTAQIDAAGSILRFLYDGFQRRKATVGPDENVLNLIERYNSRVGNGGTFNPQDPNTTLTLQPAGGGFYENLAAGDDWRQRWTASNPGDWSAAASALVHSGTQAGTLTLQQPAAFANGGIACQAAPQAALASPLGIAIGSAAKVQWNPTASQWELWIGGTQQAISSAGSATPWSWLLLLLPQGLIFYADGQRIFSYVGPSALAGPLQLFVADPVAFRDLLVFFDPRVSQAFVDGAGRSRQSQSLADAAAIAAQTLYDPIGRAAVQTKPAQVTPDAAHPLLGYRSDLVTAFDWTTGVLQGLVAGAYPGDAGYPYTRQLFEASPLGRVIEKGLPGADFAINLANPTGHTTKITYGASDGSFNLPASQYFVRTMIDAQGAQSLAFTDQTGVAIGQAASSGSNGYGQSFNQYDGAGNLTSVQEPNYFQPPAGSTPTDWVIGMTYDFLGNRLSRTAPDAGTTQYVYDPAGKVRFLQDPVNAAAGNIVYRKYDVLGRLVESGYHPFAWNRQTLQGYADSDPSWPPVTTTWRKRLFYDGDGADPNAINRLWEVWTNNAYGTDRDVEEDFRYDVYGNVLEKGLQVAEVAAQRTAVTYQYNNLSQVTGIGYPSPLGSNPGLGLGEVLYGYDRLGQVQQIGSASVADLYATFSYNADGTLAGETLNAGGAQPYPRTATYNPPGWLSRSQTAITPGASAFSESLSYTSGGVGGAGYYDGQVAAAAYGLQWTGAPEGYTYQYQYDPLKQLQVADNTPLASFDLGVGVPLSYDANGNFQQVDRAGTVYTYAYVAGTDQVSQVTAPGGAAVQSFTYDDDGAVSTAPAGAGSLTFTYDLVSRLSRTITATGGAAPALTLAYDGGQQRVLKQVQQGGATASTLYVRGTDNQTLLQQTGSGPAAAAVYYVYGPSGLIATVNGGTLYFVLRDYLGSSRVVLDTQGTVVAGYDYLPFGALARTYGNAGILSYLFTGQEYDAEIGLYNFRARFYDGTLGRFYAPDPANQFFSPYVYAANNPTLMVDPTGQSSLEWWEWLLIGVGAVVAIAGAVVLAVVTGGAAAPEEVAVGAEVVTDITITAETGAVATTQTVAEVAAPSLANAAASSLGSESLDLGISSSVGQSELLGSESAASSSAAPQVEDALPENVIRVVKAGPNSAEPPLGELKLRPDEQGLSVFERLADPSPSRVAQGVQAAGKTGNLRAVSLSVQAIRQQIGLNVVRTPGGLPAEFNDVNAVHWELQLPASTDLGGRTVAQVFNETFSPLLKSLGQYIA